MNEYIIQLPPCVMTLSTMEVSKFYRVDAKASALAFQFQGVLLNVVV